MEKEVTPDQSVKDENNPSEKEDISPQDKKNKKNRFKKDNQLEELQQKLAESNDKFLRLFAEFDNYRKRAIREKSEIINRASEDLIISLLPVLDDFDRALQSMKDTADIQSVKEGTQLIHTKLKGILEQKGLSCMDSMDKPFDTDFHEAITSIDAGEEGKGKVVDVIQKGYLVKDKVVRFAQVVVGN